MFANLDGDGAWKLGRSYKGAQTPGWFPNGRVQAMRAVIADKFKAGTALSNALLATKNAYLVEHTPKKGRDNFWSDDWDGTGTNMLGQILMEQRQALGGAGVVSKPVAYTKNVKNLH